MDGVNEAVPGNVAPPEDTWSVAQLNREIKQVVTEADARFPTHVVGEVAEVDTYGFGTFFELRDLKDEPVISCLAWSQTTTDNDHTLEAGTRTVVEATVDFYPDRGDCQLLVSNYWPLGASQRRREFDALRRELTAEGLFDDQRKQSIAPYPACVGLVTSPAGSAREDAWSAITDRSPRTDVTLCGATVQGEDAVPSLVGALNQLEADPAVETIILTRGGGSDVDLWCFNAEPLVRCVASCSTPVVAAIGHEDDDTLVGEAADARAMTPTDAGVAATTPIADVKEQVGTLERRIETAFGSLVADRLEVLERRIDTAHETLEQRATQRASLSRRGSNLERRVTVAYETLVTTRLDALERRIETALGDLELAAATAVTPESVTGERVAGLERRIDTAYEARVTRDLEQLDRRIDRAYRDLEAEHRVQAKATEARRLRIVIAVLVGLVLLGGLAALVVL
jgi:exodeoxyribonuclease VII large subunit